MRGSLNPFAHLMQDPDPERMRAMARQLYEQSGGKLMLLNADWIDGWAPKKETQAIAAKALRTKPRFT